MILGNKTSLAAALLFPLLLVMPQANTALAQRITLQGQSGNVPVFLPPPRELQRELSRAQKDIDEESYVDAITRLNFILNGRDDEKQETVTEDYFLPAQRGKPRNSLLHEVDRMLATLPEKGRQAYELAFGTEAKQQLKQAIAGGGLFGDR